MVSAYSHVSENRRTCQTSSQSFGVWACCIIFLATALLLSGQEDRLIAAADPNQPEKEQGHRLDNRPETEKIIEADLPTQETITRIIRILDKESVEVSLSKLDDVALYTWPGWILTMGEMEDLRSILRTPLKPSVGQRDVVVILANRRFLKVMHELSLLPKEKAADLVSREITSSLTQYKILFDSYMSKHASTLEHNVKMRRRIKSVGFVHSSADGVPTLFAMRFKVLALALIAGNLQLQQAQPAVARLLETAIQQRDMFYAQNAFHERDAGYVLYQGSLYNRQIIATAVIGTYLGPDEATQTLKGLDSKLKTERLTRHNSVATRHDLYAPEKRVPVDYSKGELVVEYLAPMDDAAFDKVIDAVREARAEQNANRPEAPGQAGP